MTLKQLRENLASEKAFPKIKRTGAMELDYEIALLERKYEEAMALLEKSTE